MPSDTIDLEQHSLQTSNFGFSATRLDDLGATEYTLVTLAVDVSTSVQAFKKDMEACIKEIVNACRHSPRADNLLIRLLTFSNILDEMHGFKPLDQCNEGDYEDCLKLGGMTALADATVNSIEALQQYGKDLVESDYDTNGILIVITDGMDNRSTNTAKQAKDHIEAIRKEENLESLVSILVGVNVKEVDIGIYLKDFEGEVGFTQYVEVDNATASTMAKLAEFVSKSISAQSQSLNTGGPSQPLAF